MSEADSYATGIPISEVTQRWRISLPLFHLNLRILVMSLLVPTECLSKVVTRFRPRRPQSVINRPKRIVASRSG